MKKVLLILSVLSFFPISVLAGKGVKPLPVGKTSGSLGKILGGTGTTGTAFTNKLPHGIYVELEGQGVDAQLVDQSLTAEAKRELNRSHLQGETEATVASVISQLPVIRSNMGNRGVSLGEYNNFSNALVAAAQQSNGWNDPTAQKNLIQFAAVLANEGIEGNEDKVEEVIENCVL